ncbi:hypothetical protein H1R20_g12867, partial [Candolleomyces eurysporus]
MGAPGFLAVFSDPGSEATLEEFQDWYDNEHIPLRLNHLRFFLSGARYSAVDGQRPEWLAMYEIDDVASFQDPSYTILREKRSDREGELIGRLGVLDRRTTEVAVDTGEQPEKSTGLRVGIPSTFIVTVGIAVLDGEGTQEKLQVFAQKTVSLPGWVRTRIVKVFDKGVTGLNGQWTSIEIPDYLAVVELTSKLQLEEWEKAIEGQLNGLGLVDRRQWGLYKAYPGIAQGNLQA